MHYRLPKRWIIINWTAYKSYLFALLPEQSIYSKKVQNFRIYPWSFKLLTHLRVFSRPPRSYIYTWSNRLQVFSTFLPIIVEVVRWFCLPKEYDLDLLRSPPCQIDLPALGRELLLLQSTQEEGQICPILEWLDTVSCSTATVAPSKMLLLSSRPHLQLLLSLDCPILSGSLWTSTAAAALASHFPCSTWPRSVAPRSLQANALVLIFPHLADDVCLGTDQRDAPRLTRWKFCLVFCSSEATFLPIWILGQWQLDLLLQ